jgi:hypothetical protein
MNNGEREVEKIPYNEDKVKEKYIPRDPVSRGCLAEQARDIAEQANALVKMIQASDAEQAQIRIQRIGYALAIFKVNFRASVKLQFIG